MKAKWVWFAVLVYLFLQSQGFRKSPTPSTNL